MLEAAEVQCPVCWEMIEIELDLSEGSTSYIEDCSVCCHPMRVTLEVDEAYQYRLTVDSEA